MSLRVDPERPASSGKAVDLLGEQSPSGDNGWFGNLLSELLLLLVFKSLLQSTTAGASSVNGMRTPAG